MRSNYFSLLGLQAKKDSFSVQTVAEGRGSRTGDPKTASGNVRRTGHLRKVVGSRWQSGWWPLEEEEEEEDGLRGGQEHKKILWKLFHQ